MSETRKISTVEELCADQLARAIGARLRSLRKLADDIEGQAWRTLALAREGQGTYGRVPSEMEHAITWGVADLNLETLMSIATDADIARAKGE